MATYIVKPGMTFGAFGTFREGDLVHLDPVAAAPFMDKLALVPDDIPVEPEFVPETAPVVPAEVLAEVEAEVEAAVLEEVVAAAAPKKPKRRGEAGETP